MEVMHENLERLTALTKQMLDLSITEQGGYKINKVPTDLNNLIGNVLKTFKISLQQNDIHIYKHLCKPHLVANVDNEEYAKIVSNLLSNASKYCRGIIRLSLTKKETLPDSLSGTTALRLVRSSEKNIRTVLPDPREPKTWRVGWVVSCKEFR